MSEAIQIHPQTTALVLIDLQNGIVSREIKPHSASEIVTRSRTLAEAFRAKGAPVIYVRVQLNDFLALPSDEKMNIPREIPAAASEIADAAGMQPGDLLITKRHWGAFAKTNLEAELRSRGVDTIVLCGIATNIGVESTLRQGTGLGFSFITIEDACGTFSPEMQQFAFQYIFPRLSHVRSTAEVLAALA